MSTHTWKKCPHCRKTYESYTTYTKQYQSHTGSPFIICKSCGQTFVDKEIKEPALEPYSDSGYSVFNCIFAFFMPFGLTGIILTGCAFELEEQHIALYIIAGIVDLVYISLTVYTIKNRKTLQGEGRIEYEESEKRLNNYEYALALKQAGFSVPAKFLDKSGDD